MSARAFVHGLRYSLRRFKCKHPAMTRATVTVVGVQYMVGAWFCPDCGLTLNDTGPVMVT